MESWNRYYDPDTGRYISADPIGLDGGINLYVYVGGDPVDGIDSKGLNSVVIPKILGEVIGEFGKSLLDAGISWTIGSSTGAVCASIYCKRRYVPSWNHALSTCMRVFKLNNIPPGSPGSSADLLLECADKCVEFTKRPEFKKHCSCK